MFPNLVKGREKTYPLRITGRYQRLRGVVGNLLIVFLGVLPWIQWDARQAVLVDLDARRFFIFGATFTPRDTILLVVLLLGAAFTLFFITALFGRLWCGYACPQTVFLDSWIRPLEEWIEGPRAIRRKRDQSGWTVDRWTRKALKWSLFALLAGGVAMTVVSLLTPARELWTGDGPVWGYRLAFFLGALGFWDLAWFREQFCHYLCPYARFQAALTDDNSLVISYDAPRGDLRGNKKARKAAPGVAFGDCIDCNKCVAVCPYGVDIRKGYQLECINCARCVDACTTVMGKMQKESLIRYSTESEDEGRKKKSWLRGRTVIYVGLLATLAVSLTVLLLGRSTLDASIARAPGTLFAVDDTGVRNTYFLNVTNQAEEAVTLEVTLSEDLALTVPPITLQPAEARSVPVVVHANAEQVTADSMPLHFTVASPSEARDIEATFRTPGVM